jgi:exodeoxyribonuclease VII large subunit
MKQAQEEVYSSMPVLTLSELNAAIKATLEIAFSESVWVISEISEIRCNSRGHCYLELVEREEEKTISQIRANIWAYTFRNLSSKFKEATGETLQQGMKVLLQVNVTFHEVYGLSLNVKDIDPTYSLGEMAKKKREVIERLTKEGFIDLNKKIPLPLVPQRIAIISSKTAAGYGDFIDHIDDNPYGYKIFHTLHQALMQGQEAEASILSSLDHVRRQKTLYDAVVIIRGGGSQVDLSCFDTYRLAVEVAKFPLPVITGIGHQRDDTVVDMVSHTKLKTPTAVADFLLSGMSIFEERLLDAQSTLTERAKEFLREEGYSLQYLIQTVQHMVKDRLHGETKRTESALHRLIHGSTQIVDGDNNKLTLDVNKLMSGVKILFQGHESKIRNFEQAIRLLDPVNILKRGFSITYLHEKAIKDRNELQKGNLIRTKFFRGSVKSKVEAMDVKE